MKRPLNILIVEDSEDDMLFLLRELERHGYSPTHLRVETDSDFSAALAKGGWDAVIADYNLPQFGALEALEILQQTGLDLPFIIVSGAIGEEVAVAAMKSGAHDYILKNSLVRLVPAVERELRDARSRRERKEAVQTVAALSKLGQSLAATLTPLDAARIISHFADELIGWEAFTLQLYSAREDQVVTVLHVDTDRNRKLEAPASFQKSDPSVAGRRVIAHGAELVNDKAKNSPDGHPHSALGVPIRNEARVIGLIFCENVRHRAYTDHNLKTLQALADYCCGALERISAREELRTSREELRALAAHLQSVREEERKFITREIHDELGQSLTGFKMDLAWMRNRLQNDEWPAVRTVVIEKMKTMGTLLDGMATLMRRLCTELRPGVLDDLGLVAAFEWQAREYQNRTGIACELKLELGDLAVDAERSTAFFRIFQEILTNAARHSQATRINVILKISDHNVILVVSDNGRGIKKSEIAGSKSLGLVGMRERAVILGGDVDISGAPGAGTTIKVTVPLGDLKPAGAAEAVKLNHVVLE